MLTILIPFLKDVVRNVVPDTERLEGFPMRQGLCLVLKVKPFEIFTAVHNYKILFAAKVGLSINSHFLTAYVLTIGFSRIRTTSFQSIR